MKFKALPVTSLEDATIDFEQLQTLDILNRTAENVMDVPAGAMVSRTRVMGTAYQPNTSRPTLVIVTFTLNPTATAEYEAQVLMDAANPPTTAIASTAVTAGTSAVNGFIPVTFIVPAGFFYKFLTVLGSPAVASTFEYAL